MVADLLGQTLEGDGGRRVSGWPGSNRFEYLGLAEGEGLWLSPRGGGDLDDGGAVVRNESMQVLRQRRDRVRILRDFDSRRVVGVGGVERLSM